MNTAPAADRPNIILIVMDDMGFGDTACYGPSPMATPNMQRLAAEGAAFTRMYTAPTCSPARAQLLTGRYAQRVGIPRVLFPRDTIGLTESCPTVATHLRALGCHSLRRQVARRLPAGALPDAQRL